MFFFVLLLCMPELSLLNFERWNQIIGKRKTEIFIPKGTISHANCALPKLNSHQALTTIGVFFNETHCFLCSCVMLYVSGHVSRHLIVSQQKAFQVWLYIQESTVIAFNALLEAHYFQVNILVSSLVQSVTKDLEKLSQRDTACIINIWAWFLKEK